MPFPPVILTRNSSPARHPLSRVNVTGLLRRLQVKIENIYLFKIIVIKKHGDVLKNWLGPYFLSLPKNSQLPKLRGGSPPDPYAYEFSYNANQWQSMKFAATFEVSFVWLSIVHRLTDTNRCQLTEINRALSIDRLVFRSSISSTV